MLQALVGAAILLWPRRLRAPWYPRARSGDTQATRGVVAAQRLVGSAFLVSGSLFTYFAIRGGYPPDASQPGTPRVALTVFAVAWCLLGVVMALRPEYVRSMTNPGWANASDLWRGGSSLVAYRITGTGFIAMGVVVLLVLAGGR